MTKLSDTQLIILSRACAREDRAVLPLPETLKGGAVQKVVQSLINKGMIAEAPAQPCQPRWREGDDGAVTLVATDAAFEAVGMEPPAGNTGGRSEITPTADTDTIEKDGATDGSEPQPRDAPTAVPARRTRENTKQAQLIGMLEKGATVEEIAAATGWQKHTVRGAMAGALKKRLGLTITSEKIEGRGRVYTVART